MTKWAIVYREIASQLQKFQQKNKKTVDTALFNLLNNDPEYVKTNPWLNRLAVKFETDRLDPIQLFCSFSSSTQKPPGRIQNINHILRLLGAKKNYPSIDFEGCPAPFTIRMGSARPPGDQKEIWMVFQSIFKEGRPALQQKYFDQARNWYGIELSAFTIFLFWIDSTSFIPLDKHTVDYLYATKIISTRPDTLFQYTTLLNSIPQSNIQNIVAIAYQQKGRQKNLSNPPAVVAETPTKATGPAQGQKVEMNTFRFLGLHLLTTIDPKLRKVLLPGWYLCYESFEFLTADRVIYHPDQDLDLYSNDKFNIQISAIVGPNGSGKSTFTELFYAAINNLAHKHPQFDEVFTPVGGLHLELYFKTDFLYRLNFEGDNIRLYQYEFEENIYLYPREISFNDFDFGHFFYTVAVNYAHYSLNSRHIGKWIDQLFHKNDGYQTPLVINPYRQDGNININREHTLLKNRLLVNLLEPVRQPENEDDFRPNMRQITEKQGATGLTFSINPEKFGWSYKYEKRWFSLLESGKQWETVIPEIYSAFGIGKIEHIELPGKPRDWIGLVHNYLLRKVVNIATRYAPYRKVYFDQEQLKLTDIKGLIALIKSDPSHITFKFKQAVNFLKYHQRVLPLIDFKPEKPAIDLEELSIVMEKIKIDFKAEAYRTLELLPPSFIDTDIILNDGEFFHDLSSGEKQRIYTVSSVVYHLINISSVTNIHDLTRYRFVNIIFDEVELYFHPEMQRAFINYMLNYLSYVELNLSALNLLFITHSPFILSDIPRNNILCLSPNSNEMEFGETLGANIHDLLAHSFFLQKGFMGEFIKKQVFRLTEFLMGPETETDEWDEHKAKNMIAAIGEPLIKDRLGVLYQLKYPRDLDLQIEELELELNRLKDAKNKR